MKKVLAMLFIACGFLFSSNSALADLNLEIVGGINSGRKIAVVPFAGQVGLPTDYAKVISSDLSNSGIFSPINSSSIPLKASHLSEITPSSFSADTEAVVVGTIAKSMSKQNFYEINFELGQLTGGQVKPLKSFHAEVPASKLRLYAHNISDIVFQQLTGVKGAFSTKIAYIRTKAGTRHPYELCVSDYDGANETRLVISSQPLMSPSWSKDGKSLVYVSFENRKAEIYTINIATKQRSKLTSFPGLNSNPTWSPDGSKLAMVLSKDGNPEIYTLNLSSKSIRRITTNTAIDTEPSWSADGNSLYFVSERGGKAQVYNVNLGNGAISKITSNPTKNLSPAPLPNGQGLIMINQGSNGFNVARQDFNGGFYQLSYGRLDESPTVSPNGTMVIYASIVGGKKGLSLVSTDGRTRINLPRGNGELSSPSWSSN